MALLNIDLSQTPDQRQVIKAGIYGFVIRGVQTKAPNNPATKGMNLVFDIEVVQPADSPDVGRSIDYYVFLPADSKRADAFTGLKRIALSAQVPMQGGINTDHFVGKMIIASVFNGTRKDEQTGMMKETYGIGEVFIPSDNVRPGQGGVAGANGPQGVDPASLLGGPANVQPVAPQVPSAPAAQIPPPAHVAAPVAPQIAPPVAPQMPPQFTPPVG